MPIKWRILIKDILLAPWRMTKFIVGMLTGIGLLCFLVVMYPFLVWFLNRYTTVNHPKEWYNNVCGEAVVSLVDWAVLGRLSKEFEDAEDEDR